MQARQLSDAANEICIAVERHIQAGKGVGVMSIHTQLGYHNLWLEPFKEPGNYLFKSPGILVISCIHGHGYIHTVPLPGTYADLVNKTGARK